jgi:hypothetical protein
MNAAFFGLAFIAALNPKLLVIDLILARNRRPRMMFVCFLLGGMGMALAVGLLDVLVLHIDVIKIQNHASGWLDLALGIPLLAAGELLAANYRRGLRQPHSAAAKPPPKLELWAERVLHEPHYGLAVLIGAAVGTPGASYLLALNDLVSSTLSTAAQVVAVMVFVCINFALVIVPFVFYLFRPLGTEAAVKRFEDWITSHERQIAAAVALLAGGYMVILGLVRVI